MLHIYIATILCICRISTRCLQSKLPRLLYVHSWNECCVCLHCIHSRFTLIVDNTVSLLESRDYVDQQMVAEIIGGHTSGDHQRNNSDPLLSHSDFEQVLYTVYVAQNVSERSTWVDSAQSAKVLSLVLL